MCDPVTIGVVMGAGALVKGYSEYTAGQSEAKIADANAALARGRAADAIREGGVEAGQARARGAAVASEQKLAVASSGVDPSSATNLFETTAAGSELDALKAKNNAARRAWGFDVEAASDDVKATMARRRSYLGPLGSALGAAGQVAGMRGSGSSYGGGADNSA